MQGFGGETIQPLSRISRIPERKLNLAKTSGLVLGNYNPNTGYKQAPITQIGEGLGDLQNSGTFRNTRPRGSNSVNNQDYPKTINSVVRNSHNELSDTKNNSFNNTSGSNHIKYQNQGNGDCGFYNISRDNNEEANMIMSSKQQALPPRIRQQQSRESGTTNMLNSTGMNNMQNTQNSFGQNTQNTFKGLNNQNLNSFNNTGTSEAPLRLNLNGGSGSVDKRFGSEKGNLVVKDHFELREQFVKEQVQQREQERVLQQQREKEEREREEAEKRENYRFQEIRQQELQEQERQAKIKAQQMEKTRGRKDQIQEKPCEEQKYSDKESFQGYTPNILERQNSNSKIRNQGDSLQKKVFADTKKVDEQLAVATGVQEAPIEDSTALDEELEPCPEGCGRSFAAKALEKHIPICKKVFQQKRAEFNTQQKRLVDQEQAKLIRQAKMKEKITTEKAKKTGKKELMNGTKTNWKEQSEALREKIKQNKPPKPN